MRKYCCGRLDNDKHVAYNSNIQQQSLKAIFKTDCRIVLSNSFISLSLRFLWKIKNIMFLHDWTKTKACDLNESLAILIHKKQCSLEKTSFAFIKAKLGVL